LGRDLLVAPMIDPDGTRAVYLPAGESWVDWWTGEVHAGGRYLRVTSPLAQIPLFVRHGALIPVAPVTDFAGDAPFDDLTLLSFGGEGGTTTIHDVNGDTTVTAERVGDTFAVTVAGPAPVRRAEGAPVPAPTAPSTVAVPRAAVSGDSRRPGRYASAYRRGPIRRLRHGRQAPQDLGEQGAVLVERGALPVELGAVVVKPGLDRVEP